MNADNWKSEGFMHPVQWPTVNSTHSGSSWCRDCHVHAGFAAAYDELSSQMFDRLSLLRCDNTSVVGHSIGAAVATVAAMDLRGSGNHVDMLWTFGSPRVGDDAFVSSYVTLAEQQYVNPPSWRVVHYEDPMPGAPPDVGLGHYKHIPALVYYNTRNFTGESSGYTVCPWSRQNLTNEGNCGNAQSSLLATAINDVQGLVGQDHTTYLGVKVGQTDLEAQCYTNNSYADNRTVIESRGGSSLALIAWILFGCFAGSVLMHQNHKFNIVPHLVAERPPIPELEQAFLSPGSTP